MPKRPSTEEHLAILRRLRSSADPAAAATELTTLLAHPILHGMVVKGAATLAERFAARSCAPELARHIAALMGKDAPKRDPGCEGKTAAMKTLLAWEADLPDLYLQTAVYRQLEPTFGGSVDTAGELRGLAALGIAATRPLGAIEMLVELLVDPQKTARTGAAVALGRWRGTEAVPLLRLKARLGDEDGDVIGETLASLLQQDGARQFDFVAGFLAAKIPAVVEAAALALGQSKIEGALEKLTPPYAALRGSPLATTLLMAIGLVRSENAVAWLLQRLQPAGPKEALAILDALRPFRGDPRIATQVKATVKGREELEEAATEIFGP